MASNESRIAYVPMEIRQALAARRDLPDDAWGAALFADISGFTGAAGRYADEYGATRGAEELGNHLEAVFEALTREVHDQRGSVVGFSGDAITCWFDDAQGASSAASRAVTAACAMQRSLEAVPAPVLPSGEELSIGVKVAIAAGPARRMQVGDANVQRIPVFGGVTLERMAEAESLAQLGEVLVSAEVPGACEEALEVVAWRQHASGRDYGVMGGSWHSAVRDPWPDPVIATDAPIAQWLHRDLHAAMSELDIEYLSEFRRVAAVFIKFDGIDFDDDGAAAHKLDALVRLVQDTADRYEGHLVDISIGDKGSYLFVALGALRRHEDDPRRAVLTARDLLQGARALGFVEPLRIGIADGDAYVGAYGCPARRTHGILGASVVQAARLMELAAPGELLATEPVAAATESFFEWHAGAAVTLKGEARPVRPQSLINVRQDAGEAAEAAPLFGRERERRLFSSLLRSGDSPHLLLEGEAGMGKTHLLQAVVSELAQGYAVLSGGADSIQRLSSLYPWRAVFEALFGIAGCDDPLKRIERVRAFFEAHLSTELERLPLLADVLELDLPDSALTGRMEGDVRADSTNVLLTRIVGTAAAQREMLIVLEDLHWFDSRSLDLLALLAREQPELRMIATRRPHDGIENDPLAAIDFRTEVVGALAAEDLSAVLRATLEASDLHPMLAELIATRSEGSPFAAQEIALALRDAGSIVVEGGLARPAAGVTSAKDLELPTSIQNVVASRVDRLAPAQQLTLKVASVIGQSFDLGLLEDVYPSTITRGELRSQLASLERNSFVVPDDPGYRFRHALTQSVVYELLPHQQRSRFHGALGAWYEDRYRAGAERELTQLAHHFSAAARSGHHDGPFIEKTLGYLEQARDVAFDSSGHREAVELLTTAKSLIAKQQKQGDEGREARWDRGLAESYFALGELRECVEACYAGLNHLKLPVPMERAGIPRRILGQLAGGLARHFLPGSAKTLSEVERQRITTLTSLWRVLGKSLYHTNDSLRMLFANAYNWNHSEQLGASPELGHIYSHLCMTLGVFGMRGGAERFGELSADMIRTTGQPNERVPVLINVGVYNLGAGNWRRAQELLGEAQALTDEVEDDSHRGEGVALRGILGDLAWLQDDLAESSRIYGDLRQLATRSQSPLYLGWSVRPLALAALREGQAGKASTLLGEALEHARDAGDRLTQIDVLGLLALAELRQGHLESALEAVVGAETLIERTEPPVAYPQYLGYASVAEVRLTLWERAVADGLEAAEPESLAKLASKRLRAYARSFPIGRPRALTCQAWAEAIAGRESHALKTFQRAIAEADALAMRYEKGFAHLRAGRCLNRDSERELEAAVAVFKDVGAPYDAELARAASA